MYTCMHVRTCTHVHAHAHTHLSSILMVKVCFSLPFLICSCSDMERLNADVQRKQELLQQRCNELQVKVSVSHMFLAWSCWRHLFVALILFVFLAFPEISFFYPSFNLVLLSRSLWLLFLSLPLHFSFSDSVAFQLCILLFGSLAWRKAGRRTSKSKF